MLAFSSAPEIKGDPGDSVPIISGSVALELPLDVLYKNGASTGKRAKTVVIYTETADIRFALGVDPNPSTPFGYPVSSESWLVLDKWSEISNFRHIRALTTDANLTATGYF